MGFIIGDIFLLLEEDNKRSTLDEEILKRIYLDNGNIIRLTNKY